MCSNDSPKTSFVENDEQSLTAWTTLMLNFIVFVCLLLLKVFTLLQYTP